MLGTVVCRLLCEYIRISNNLQYYGFKYMLSD